MIQPPNAVSFLTLLVRPARPFVCLKGRICELSNPSFHVKCTDHRRKKRERERREERREARQSNMQLLYKLVHELSSSTCAAQLCVIATTVCLSLLIPLSSRLSLFVSLFMDCSCFSSSFSRRHNGIRSQLRCTLSEKHLNTLLLIEPSLPVEQATVQ